MVASFERDLQWSLTPANTTTAVRLLHKAWPAHQWVLCCHTTDKAGCDILGVQGDRPPIRVDLKVRHGCPPDPTSPDAVFDIEYVTETGARLPGPLFRPGPLPVDFYLFCWPDADPQVGALVETYRSQIWLREYGLALKRYTTTSNRASGSEWSTTFVAPSVDTLNACAGGNVARVLTVTTTS